MITSAPKFKRVELLLKDTKNKNDMKSLYKIGYDDCAMVITGDYIIITIENNNYIDEPSSVTGKIHKLEEIDSYRIFNE